MPVPLKSQNVKSLVLFLALAAIAPAAIDLDKPIPELRTGPHTILKNVVFVKFAETSVTARWQGGLGSINYADMPDEVRAAALKRVPKPAPLDLAALKARPDVTVGWDDTQIQVTNVTTQSWPMMEIYLNHIPDGFRYSGPAPAPGAKIRLELTKFVNKAGQRFNPAQHGVNTAWIGGSGRDFLAFTSR